MSCSVAVLVSAYLTIMQNAFLTSAGEFVGVGAVDVEEGVIAICSLSSPFRIARIAIEGEKRNMRFRGAGIDRG